MKKEECESLLRFAYEGMRTSDPTQALQKVEAGRNDLEIMNRSLNWRARNSSDPSFIQAVEAWRKLYLNREDLVCR